MNGTLHILHHYFIGAGHHMMLSTSETTMKNIPCVCEVIVKDMSKLTGTKPKQSIWTLCIILVINRIWTSTCNDFIMYVTSVCPIYILPAGRWTCIWYMVMYGCAVTTNVHICCAGQDKMEQHWTFATLHCYQRYMVTVSILQCIVSILEHVLISNRPYHLRWT